MIKQQIIEYALSVKNDGYELDNTSLVPSSIIDIYYPELKFAIIYNSLEHNSYGDWFKYPEEDKETHLNKTIKCREHDIQLFHIFENEWRELEKQDVLKSMLQYKLGKTERLFARKCQVRKVNSTETRSFLVGGHLQGYAPASINYGAFFKGHLMALMTLSSSRFDKTIDFELIRYANKPGTSVIGGASKIFKAFLKDHPGCSVISYADRRRSNGGLYLKLGFTLSHIAGPNYFYFSPKSRDPYTLMSRQRFQKHKLNTQLDNFDETKTEVENCYMNGYRRIFDCGNLVLKYQDNNVPVETDYSDLVDF